MIMWVCFKYLYEVDKHIFYLVTELTGQGYYGYMANKLCSGGSLSAEQFILLLLKRNKMYFLILFRRRYDNISVYYEEWINN